MNIKVAKILKKTTLILLIVALIVCLGAAIYVGTASSVYRAKVSYIKAIEVELNEGAAVKNTILMIGDGMGAQHIEAAKGHYNLDNLFMETMDMNGFVTTFSKSGVTDSAAAATALSTGVKVQNGAVSMDKGENLQTMSEYAKKHGKSVGIITTESLYGATPAGFSAHASSRVLSSEITRTQLESGVDLFIGATELSKYASYEYDIEAAGYDYVNNFGDLSYSSDKIFAIFNKMSTDEGTNTEPTLSQVVSFAIDYLESKSDKGYFLMVEGAHIDKRSHSNDMAGMLKEIKGFDEAIETAVKEATEDTFIMVTADHETGDLQYNGEKGSAINNSLFHSGGHTGSNVRYFATNHIKVLPDLIDNTNVASIFRQLIAQ